MRNTAPPKWMDRFLAWYCRPELLEEIQGDLYELFDRIASASPTKAKLQFVWNVLRFCRWQNIRRTKGSYSTNYTIMFQNYLVIGLRNALHHRLNTSINMIGLALAIGCAITVSLFIDNRLNADTFITNIDRIYQVTSLVQKDQSVEDWSDSPILLGPSMLESESGIEAMTRVEYANASIRYRETVFSEFVWFVDPDFSGMFNFPILQGDGNVLEKKGHLMIAKDVADKYFGEDDPIGQHLSIKFGNKIKEDFTVGAVFERPFNSSFYPQVLFPMEDFKDLKLKDTYDWSYLTDGTFIMLKPSYDVAQLAKSMEKYKALQNAASPEWVIEGFRFHPLRGLSGESHAIISFNFQWRPSGRPFVIGCYRTYFVVACLLQLHECGRRNCSHPIKGNWNQKGNGRTEKRNCPAVSNGKFSFVCLCCVDGYWSFVFVFSSGI